MIDYRLADLLDLSIIQKMAEAHYRASNMPLGILDAADGSILVGCGWQDICVRYHRMQPLSLQRCHESDKFINDRLEEGQACRYKCKNGLQDIGMPIIVSGRHLATLFMGQFFYEGETLDRDFFVRQAHECGFDVDGYLSALDKVPVISREKVDYIVEYDLALVRFIADLAENSLSKIIADEKMRESEREFQAIFDQDYHYLQVLTTEGTVTKANRAATLLFGADNAKFLDKLVWETPFWAHSHDQQEMIKKAVQQAVEGELIQFEATHLSVDGIRHYVDYSIKPVNDDTGNVVLLILEGRNITDRMLAEKQIQRSSDMLHAIINAAPTAIIDLDLAGKVHSVWNPAAEKMFGWSAQEAIGQPLPTVQPEQQDEFNYIQSRIRSGEVIAGLDVRRQRRDGTSIYYSIHAAPLRDTEGRLTSNILVLVDITERKTAEKERERLLEEILSANTELTRINKDLNEFTYIASHDLQEPLRKLISFSQFLQNDLPGELPERAAKDLGFIMDAAHRMQNLIQDLLDFSRTGRVELQERLISLDACLDSALDDLNERMQESKAELIRKPLPELRVDRQMIRCLFQNLVGNALKFARPGDAPRINISAARDADGWTIEVRDNGIGIDPKYAEQIFAPFKRLHGRNEYEGTGIGLAICQKIVERHGGSIRVESRLGQGARFLFTLPEAAS
jgi:PAS domain S-box-containing protein